jgi:7,8-dihydroneopterin aldolase/epimerase/oxygenase
MLDAMQYPSLLDCRRLFLRDYEIYINIGVHDFEKKAEQRVILNIDLYIPFALNTPTKDTLEEVLDYDFMRETIRTRAHKGHIHLQETLCDDIVSAMLAHPNVMAARVSTAKPDVYADCHSVGVEVFRIKDSLR